MTACWRARSEARRRFVGPGTSGCALGICGGVTKIGDRTRTGRGGSGAGWPRGGSGGARATGACSGRATNLRMVASPARRLRPKHISAKLTVADVSGRQFRESVRGARDVVELVVRHVRLNGVRGQPTVGPCVLLGLICALDRDLGRGTRRLGRIWSGGGRPGVVT